MLGGDIVLAVNGLEITTIDRYAAMLRTIEIGQTITLQVLRNGAYQDITATIEEQPQLSTASNQTKVQESMEFRLMNQRGGPQEPGRMDVRF